MVRIYNINQIKPRLLYLLLENVLSPQHKDKRMWYFISLVLSWFFSSKFSHWIFTEFIKPWLYFNFLLRCTSPPVCFSFCSYIIFLTLLCLLFYLCSFAYNVILAHANIHLSTSLPSYHISVSVANLQMLFEMFQINTVIMFETLLDLFLIVFVDKTSKVFPVFLFCYLCKGLLVNCFQSYWLKFFSFLPSSQ